jgi:hypothetical protein
MTWDFDAEKIPGTYVKAYMAKITGEDPVY